MTRIGILLAVCAALVACAPEPEEPVTPIEEDTMVGSGKV